MANEPRPSRRGFRLCARCLAAVPIFSNIPNQKKAAQSQHRREFPMIDLTKYRPILANSGMSDQQIDEHIAHVWRIMKIFAQRAFKKGTELRRSGTNNSGSDIRQNGMIKFEKSLSEKFNALNITRNTGFAYE